MTHLPKEILARFKEIGFEYKHYPKELLFDEAFGVFGQVFVYNSKTQNVFIISGDVPIHFLLYVIDYKSPDAGLN